MGSILNFIYSDNVLLNGHEISNNHCRFSKGPLNKYIKNSKYITHTTNYEIKNNAKNFFLIEVNHINFLFNNNSDNIFKTLPVDFIHKISQKNVTLIIASIAEASNLSVELFKLLELELSKLNIDCNNVHIIDSNYDITTYNNIFKKYNSLHYILTDTITNSGLNDLKYVSKIPTIDESLNSLRKKHFISLNRTSKPHRFLLLSHIHANNLYDKFNLSYLSTPNILGIPDDLNIQVYLENKDELNKNIPLELDTELFENKQGFYTGDTLSNHYLDSYFNITTESFFFEPITTFTEKILKPIIGLQPFIVISTFNYLKKLKELGFKTFDSIWDESYDNEKDNVNRILKIFDLIDEISTWDIAECNKTYKSVLDICIYNRNHLYDMYDDDEFGKILKKIVDVC